MAEIQLPKREDIPVEDTWDLSLIFPDKRAWEEEFTRLTATLPEQKMYEGTLANGANAFLSALEWQLSLFRTIHKLYVYASLKNDQDIANADSQLLIGKAQSLYAQVAQAISWFEPELLSLPEEQLESYFTELPELEKYRHAIEEITQQRAHILSKEIEMLLASASDVFHSSSDTFGKLSNSDLTFADIQDENGNFVQLTKGNYTLFLESTNRSVRKNAFESLYATCEQFQHTFASTLNGEIKTHVFFARTRNYPNARVAALSGNHIPEAVYEQLIAAVHKHLPLLHRYVALRKKILNIRDLQPYDLYVPLVGESPLNFTYEEAKEKSLAALRPLGENYLETARFIFNHRIIDVRENEGKRSGAYSGGMYDTQPYILLNWQNNFDNLFTLIHELGHSMHSHYTRSNQPYIYGNYPIFLAEIASTTNENLLFEHFLETEQEKNLRIYLLNRYLDGFKGSIFRQTQFAEFEHFIHQQTEAGIPLTSELLSKEYGALNARYYGDALEENPRIPFEWIRIPHFYYNYYVYQYATGFAAAGAFTEKILHENGREAYLDYLKAGSSDYPLEILRKAGLDVEQADYLEKAFATFEKRFNELETLILEI